MENAEPEPPKHVLKPTSFERVNAPLSQEPSAPIEIESILRENLSVREKVEPLVLDFTKKPSRRKRDYLFLLLVGNASILLLMSFLPTDPLFHVLGLSGIGLYSAGLSWIMWGVMDNY